MQQAETPPLETARQFLTVMAQADPEALAALLTDDAVIAAPYSPKEIPLPRRNEGKAQCLQMLHAMMGNIASFEWPELDLHATDEATLVMGTGKSRIVMRNGAVYANDYCFRFIIRNGKVSEYYEYFDPAPTLAAFTPA